jgi:hypothetical protein
VDATTSDLVTRAPTTSDGDATHSLRTLIAHSFRRAHQPPYMRANDGEAKSDLNRRRTQQRKVGTCTTCAERSTSRSCARALQGRKRHTNFKFEGHQRTPSWKHGAVRTEGVHPRWSSAIQISLGTRTSEHHTPSIQHCSAPLHRDLCIRPR